ncbi:MAG: hypothetical protein HQL26_07010 [Candidatus Omnitrophica bacterium]|nr:hypothetical protein [Candidatus Omnitrophota bacterium]
MKLSRKDFLKLMGLALAAILIPFDKIFKGLSVGKTEETKPLQTARYYSQNDSLAG